MKKRFLVMILCVALLATGTLFAAGDTDAKAAPKKGPVNIEFWYSIGGNAQKATVALVEKFNASQDEVFVDALYGGSYEDTTQKLLAAVISGDTPAVAHMAMAYTAQFILEGYFESLDKYFAADSSIKESDFVEGLLELNRWQGELYGLPFNCSNPILYYNKDLFRAAGLDPEKPPVTWDELRAMAAKISALGDDIFGFNIERGSGWITQGYTWQFGGDWVAKDNSTVLWTDKGAVDALKFMQSMYNDGIASYAGGNTMLYSGKVGMSVNSTASLTNVIDSIEWDLGIGVMPKAVRSRVPIGGGSLYVFKGASQAEKDAAWKFLKFMSSAESQMFWAESTGYQASNWGAINSAEMQALWKRDPRFATTYDQTSYALVEDNTHIIPFNEVRSIFNDAWDDTILNNGNVEKNLAAAQVKANAILRQYH